MPVKKNMQLQSNSSHRLSAALQTVAKNINAKNALAILANVLLTQRQDGKFFFTASNNASQITIPAPLVVVEGKFTEPVALPVTNLVSYLSTLPDCVVNLTFQDGNICVDYSYQEGKNDKSGKFSIPYEKADEFPILRGIEGDNRVIELPTSLFLEAIGQAKYFAGNDDLRIVLNSLCLDVAKDFSDVKLVSTDGHRLISYTHTNNPKTGGSDFYRKGDAGASMLPSSYFSVLSAFSGSETIRIENDATTIVITADDIEFIGKAIEGRYPNYESVIPKNCPYHICVSKKEILSVIKRVSICASAATNMIILKKEGMFLTISAQDIDFARSARDQVFITDSECPDDFRIGFNAQMLSCAVNAINGDVVRMNLTSASHPCVITADSPNPTIRTLNMPLLIQE